MALPLRRPSLRKTVRKRASGLVASVRRALSPRNKRDGTQFHHRRPSSCERKKIRPERRPGDTLLSSVGSQAEGLLLKDAARLEDSDPYRFDIVDIQRQLMSNLGQAIHKQAAEAFRKKDKEAFALHSNRFLEMLRDVDELLRTRPEFNFDKWLTQARSWGIIAKKKIYLKKTQPRL